MKVFAYCSKPCKTLATSAPYCGPPLPREQAILLSNGCADAWSPKTLRAAMGAHFLLHITNVPIWRK